MSDPANRGRPRDTAPVEVADKAAAIAAFDPWLPWMSMAQRAAELGSRQVHQHANAQSVLAAKRRIERGEGKAILFAIVQCVEAGLAAPDWLAAAFLACYDKVMEARARSWDDVFGDPWRGTTLAEKREELEKARAIVHTTEELFGKGRSKTDPLFAEVADRVGMKGRGSFCKKIYYKWRELPEFAVVRARAAIERESRKHTRARNPSTRKKIVV